MTMLAVQARRPAAARYHDVHLAGRVASADPHALVAILYDELIAALEVLVRVSGGDRDAIAPRHERATSLLAGLQASLDLRSGGPLAHDLADIYRQMQRRLTAARQGERAAAEDVLAGVRSLAEAWSRIG